MTNPWYRHRVVKRKLLPGVRFADDPRVAGALKDLRCQVEGDMAFYLRSHHPGQTIVTEFVHQSADGLHCFAAVTLFGPPDLKKEILEELAKEGEI